MASGTLPILSLPYDQHLHWITIYSISSAEQNSYGNFPKIPSPPSSARDPSLRHWPTVSGSNKVEQQSSSMYSKNASKGCVELGYAGYVFHPQSERIVVVLGSSKRASEKESSEDVSVRR
uniref:Uncharacterized protein n=1 Tax=Coccidioides posadasii RMSCC 3488 TaxID=454284 RepID=A0A0J6FCD3_COCPO|nr:hypothetical protein CPAG_03286 [Coccidioides posadasii RMSCC 3488]